LIVAIHQPNYLPWLGFLHRVSLVDTFVLFDHVEMPRGKNWTTRNKIRLDDRWLWLTVPTVKSGVGYQRICDVEINYEQRWIRKHTGTLRQAYCCAPYYKVYDQDVLAMLEQEYELLVDLNVALIEFIVRAMGIHCDFIRSSELNVEGGRTEEIIEVCRQVGATDYISGTGCFEFFEPEQFRDTGINLHFQMFEHPTYRQVGDGFIPNMCALDLLFNCGERSLEILTQNNKPGYVDVDTFYTTGLYKKICEEVGIEPVR
jgi:hypothetical protein